LRENLV